MTTFDDSWLSQSTVSHFQTFHPDSPCVARGSLEQLRRSKLSRVWKRVLVSLVKTPETALWIQRQGTLESLHQIPVESIQQVELVDDAMAAGENRFVIRLVSDEIVFRCPQDSDAVRKWVSTIRFVSQFQQQTTMHVPKEETNLISFVEDDHRPSDLLYSRAHAPSAGNPSNHYASLRPTGPVWQQPPLISQQQQQQPFVHKQQQQFYTQQPQQQQQQQQQFYTHQPQHQQQSFYTPQAVPLTWNAPISMQRPPQPTVHRPPPPPPMNHPPPFPQRSVSQPPRSNPPSKPQPPLFRSSSAPPEASIKLPTNQPSPKTPILTQTQIKQRVTMDWALRPPAYTCLRDISQLIPSLHKNFALVPHHEYFSKYPKDLTIRKVRFFLHPDKLPRDFSSDQAYLLKLLWDVINDAWEQSKND